MSALEAALIGLGFGFGIIAALSLVEFVRLRLRRIFPQDPKD